MFGLLWLHFSGVFLRNRYTTIYSFNIYLVIAYWTYECIEHLFYAMPYVKC